MLRLWPACAALALITACEGAIDEPGAGRVDATSVDAGPARDAAPGAPDAAPGAPDAAPGAPDAAPGMPDAAPDMPDAAPDMPDAAPGMPDAAPGMPDAAPGAPDAGPAGDAGGVSCATPGLLFCEDFESYAVGPAQSARWTTHVNSARDTLTIVDDPGRVIGARALHVHTAQNEYAFIRANNLAPPNNSFFGRIRAYVDAFPRAPDYAHFTMVEAWGDPPSLGAMRPIGGQYDPFNRQAAWGIGSDGGPTGDWTFWNPMAPALGGRWLCLEWEIRASDTSLRMWIDGVFHPELTVDPARRSGLTFPNFNRVWFGWQLYQGNPTPDHFDVWLDDLALSSTRIGCP